MFDLSMPAFLAFIKSAVFVVGYISSNNLFPEPLSPEEEKMYLLKYNEGDEEARNVLIERNLRLVAHVCKKYSTTNVDADDLISIGTIGLIKGINTFKEDKGVRLATYVSRCIDKTIVSYWINLRTYGLLFYDLKNYYKSELERIIKIFEVKGSFIGECPLGEQLKYYRQLHNVGQTELAEQLQVSRDSIMDIENREIKFPNLELLNSIIDILNIRDKIVLPDYIKFLMDNPSKKIIAFKKEKKLSHNEFAELLDLDRSNLRKWLNGQVQISMKGYEKLKLAGVL